MNFFVKLPVCKQLSVWNKKFGVMHCVRLAVNDFEMQVEVKIIFCINFRGSERK